jgi:hypothetical protein
VEQWQLHSCGKYAGELYMLRNKLWKSLGLTPTDRLCLACLSKRLGRPFTVSDFTQPPLCNKAIRGVLAANEALARTTRAHSETGAIEPTLRRAGSSRRR